MAAEKNVPEIRFKGFVGEWKDAELSQIIDVRSGKDYKHLSEGNIPVFGTGGYMLSVNEALSYNENAIGIGRKGTIDKPFILKSPFWTVDTLFYAVPRKENDLEFIFDVFQKINWKQKDESTGVPSLSKVAINGIKVIAPTLPEQTQIGTYFQHLDSLINLNQRKYDKLLTVKKAMLEKMFPREGTDVPEIRFKGFEGKWEKKKLGEVLDLENGYAFKGVFFQDEVSSLIVLTPGNINIGGGFQKDKGHYYNPRCGIFNKYILQPDDIFVSMTDLTQTGQTLGFPAIIPNDGNTYLLNQRLGKLINYHGDKKYLFYLLSTEHYHKQVISTASGTTVKHSSPQKILNCINNFPTLEEQSKIGKFFELLDTLISQHQTQLEKLKNLKKGCLEKMFV